MWMWFMYALIFTGCSRKNRLPCWVNKPCQPFDAEEYIIGTGKGSSQQMADDEAVAALTQQFQLTSTTDGSAPKVLASFIAMELSGVKVVKRHQKNGVFYALASLERAPLLAQLDTEINKVHSKAKELHQVAKKNSSKIDKAHLYHQTIPLLKKMELLNEQRKIVDFNNKKVPAFASSKAFIGKKKEVLQSIKIKIVSDPTTSTIKKLLDEIFRSKGFQTQGPRADLELVMTGMEGIKPSGKAGFTKIRYQVQFNIKEPQKRNRLILLRHFTGEASKAGLYATQQAAISKVKAQILQAKIGDQLTNTILGERP